jgi:hypothetical protein
MREFMYSTLYRIRACAHQSAISFSNIMPPLINLLQNADFKTKKEACWAISNATSGALAEPSQIRYMVQQGVIKPLCDLLKSMDNKIIQARVLVTLKAIAISKLILRYCRLPLMDLTTS